ncbi:DUF1499 domain-containing protein [Prosthecomicrobium pneumaticum]|uniref:DUF1499 domain-containing protein n=1 Tax=Prosthecomicrobium pneumaticum TaxID=81895 RepID=A0A7W9CV63_9HYPH|nr:DUF1499 domain-containing protein [Prosthecomicrobium pneumaticum]MBB5751937.1 hypothetical protein [Prosthecomicrobium pneumaticum]
MPGRIRRTTAASAFWSARASLLPVPLLIVAALLHRLQAIDTVAMFASLGVALLLAAAAVGLAVLALVEIWRDGSAGFGLALRGLSFGAVALGPPAVAVAAMLVFPPLTDISTDPVDPPLFAAAPDGIWNRPPPDAAEYAVQAAAYPHLVPRHYPVAPERVFAEAQALFARRGWTVLDAQGPRETEGIGWIEGEARTLLLALEVDVVLRVLADGRGSLVDMRSAWRTGGHDLGDNARRIRGFLADLDAALQGVVDAPAAAPADAETPLVAPPDGPPPDAAPAR